MSVEQDGRDGGAHPVEIRVFGDQAGDRRVPATGGRNQVFGQIGARGSFVQWGDRLHHQARGDLAGGVAAHAVRDDEHPIAGEERILVVRADEARVGARGDVQLLARVPPRAACPVPVRVAVGDARRRIGAGVVVLRHGRSSITDRPIRIGTPTGTGVVAVILMRSR